MGQQPLGCQPGQPKVAKASENGHVEVVKLLLEHGADPTVEDNKAIRKASSYGHLEV